MCRNVQQSHPNDIKIERSRTLVAIRKERQWEGKCSEPTVTSKHLPLARERCLGKSSYQRSMKSQIVRGNNFRV